MIMQTAWTVVHAGREWAPASTAR